ncbi:DUF805 domain-containing protein [Streptomyces sp. HSW2009]|uniref:DUF805 domain-containing protein n=1 Tax=Streptomyces sp. HSW2009 TaxID=3142890 RepID=UPI0032EB58AE
MSGVYTPCGAEAPSGWLWCSPHSTSMSTTRWAMVSFPEAVRRGFTRASDWRGRSSRAEYWWFALFALLCWIPLITLALILDSPFVLLGWVGLWFFLLGTFVRRMHDCGRSGWWWFFGLVPLAGPVTILVFTCQRGDLGSNRYGPPADAQIPLAVPVNTW